MDFSNLNTWLALSVVLAYVGLFVFVIFQHRDQQDLIQALTAEVAKANANTKALDLLEPLATKVVPVQFVQSLNKGADLLETFTPDEVDLLIEQLRLLVNKATDGKPNDTPPADGSVG